MAKNCGLEVLLRDVGLNDKFLLLEFGKRFLDSDEGVGKASLEGFFWVLW